MSSSYQHTRGGWICLNKSEGLTSNQAVVRVRKLLGASKVGHAGTLDPLATGVLPIAYGEATKTLPLIVDDKKEYQFRIRWGEARNTDDCEGEITSTCEKFPTESEILNVLPRFLGVIAQIPPSFSALKVKGRRAYTLAREGQPPPLVPRQVSLYHFSLIDIPDHTYCDFHVVCGKGFYIRSLARDLAHSLGTVGHITKLQRLKVGYFTLEHSVSLHNLQQQIAANTVQNLLLPIETPLQNIPQLPLDKNQARKLRSGQKLRRPPQPSLHTIPENQIALALYEGRLIGLIRVTQNLISPIRILLAQ